MRNRTASRWLAVLLTSALLVPLLGAPPALAASSFTGGALDSVLYVPNDHTPIALRYEATGGLSPNTQYYVKVRFTVGTSPNPSTNRGFTWNPTTQAWAPDLGGANWSDFPTVMSDASGLITAGWVWAKFGDENAAGAYHILISLSDGATTYNSTTAPATTVLDMSTNGAWVHNGTTIASNLAAKRAECTSETSSGVVYSLGKTELDTVDNDSDGVVDNEDYGPVGRTSDLRLGVPVGMNFVTYVNRTTTYASARQITIADTDIALNAADQTAPSAPGAFKVEPTVHGNDLSWTAASDTGGSGLAGYRVYRRVESETPAFATLVARATPTASRRRSLTPLSSRASSTSTRFARSTATQTRPARERQRHAACRQRRGAHLRPGPLRDRDRDLREHLCGELGHDRCRRDRQGLRGRALGIRSRRRLRQPDPAGG